MNIVRYRDDEIPPITPEREAELRALDEKIASGEIKVDCSDIPEMDEFDFKYAITFGELMAMSSSQRTELAQKMSAAKEADRAAKKARQEAEQAIAEVRLLTAPIIN